MEKLEIGKITHFFDKLSVAVINLSGEIKTGDAILIERNDGSTFEQLLDSMQVNHKSVETAKQGDDIGIKTKESVKEGDTMYKLIE